eukprot:1154619-Pelagomonas_calceolata.AAC.1
MSTPNFGYEKRREDHASQVQQRTSRKKEKVCLAVPAYVDSLADAKVVPVTKPVQAGEQEQNMKVSHSIPGTLTPQRTWIILGHQPGAGTECAVPLAGLDCPFHRRAIQDDVLFVLNSVPITFIENSKLVWAPICMVPLVFHSKVVTGKA